MAHRHKPNIESTDLDNWDDYMNAKKCKLQEQFQSEACKVDIKKDIFQGTSIFVNGYTVPTADELRLLMMEYGGTYHHYYSNGKTSYMIASNLPNVKIKQFKTSNIRIVKPDWVVDSIKAGKMLDHKPYLLLSDLLPNTNTISFQNIPKSESSCQKSDSSSMEGDITLASTSRRTANDENFLEEFYNNSRLHHISTQGALFKQYINELRLKNITEFSGRENLRKWKTENRSASEYSLLEAGSCIMHIDMDCFFVSVGLKKYPHLKSCPVVVTHAKGNKTKGDNVQARKAEFNLHEKRNREKFERVGKDYKPWFTDIGETDSMAEIASCSYEARKFGIRNGMLLGQAFKLCPNLKTIPYDFEGYKEVSYALYNHVASYTLDIEAVSCDEMYVDCTGILTYANVDVLDFATILRKEIKVELTGCPCSTGFGPNRLLARLATKKAKPDGQFAVSLKESKEFIQQYDVPDLPGIGRSIATKLAGIGVKTCKDLQRIPVTRLQQEFGFKFGSTLHKYSFGEDSRPLNFSHQRKSVSAEVNYGIRFRNSLDAEKFLRKLSNEVENRMNTIGCRGKSITLKLMLKTEEAPTETAKYLGHGICNYVTKTVTLVEATSDTNVIYREVMKIVQNMQIKPSDFRGIGIQMSRLEYKKNTSTASKMDKFITKSKRPINTNDGQGESISEKSEPSLRCTDTSAGNSITSKMFDESEYDVSFSQIDQNYLAALPENIKAEVILKAKTRKKNIVDPNDYLPDQEDTSGCSFIIRENDLPKLNPMVPSTEVVQALAEWVSKETVPRDCDIKMLSDYIHELISNQEFESVNFIVDNFQRYPDEFCCTIQQLTLSELWKLLD